MLKSLAAFAFLTFALGGLFVRAGATGPNDILPEAPAKALVVKACTSCHPATQIVAKRHSADEWDELLGKMVVRGAALTEPELDQVYDYLVANFEAQPAKPAS